MTLVNGSNSIMCTTISLFLISTLTFGLNAQLQFKIYTEYLTDFGTYHEFGSESLGSTSLVYPGKTIINSYGLNISMNIDYPTASCKCQSIEQKPWNQLLRDVKGTESFYVSLGFASCINGMTCEYYKRSFGDMYICISQGFICNIKEDGISLQIYDYREIALDESNYLPPRGFYCDYVFLKPEPLTMFRYHLVDQIKITDSLEETSQILNIDFFGNDKNIQYSSTSNVGGSRSIIDPRIGLKYKKYNQLDICYIERIDVAEDAYFLKRSNTSRYEYSFGDSFLYFTTNPTSKLILYSTGEFRIVSILPKSDIVFDFDIVVDVSYGAGGNPSDAYVRRFYHNKFKPVRKENDYIEQHTFTFSDSPVMTKMDLKNCFQDAKDAIYNLELSFSGKNSNNTFSERNILNEFTKKLKSMYCRTINLLRIDDITVESFDDNIFINFILLPSARDYSFYAYEELNDASVPFDFQFNGTRTTETLNECKDACEKITYDKIKQTESCVFVQYDRETKQCSFSFQRFPIDHAVERLGSDLAYRMVELTFKELTSDEFIEKIRDDLSEFKFKFKVDSILLTAKSLRVSDQRDYADQADFQLDICHSDTHLNRFMSASDMRVDIDKENYYPVGIVSKSDCAKLCLDNQPSCNAFQLDEAIGLCTLLRKAPLKNLVNAKRHSVHLYSTSFSFEKAKIHSQQLFRVGTTDKLSECKNACLTNSHNKVRDEGEIELSLPSEEACFGIVYKDKSCSFLLQAPFYADAPSTDTMDVEIRLMAKDFEELFTIDYEEIPVEYGEKSLMPDTKDCALQCYTKEKTKCSMFAFCQGSYNSECYTFNNNERSKVFQPTAKKGKKIQCRIFKNFFQKTNIHIEEETFIQEKFANSMNATGFTVLVLMLFIFGAVIGFVSVDLRVRRFVAKFRK